MTSATAPFPGWITPTSICQACIPSSTPSHHFWAQTPCCRTYFHASCLDAHRKQKEICPNPGCLIAGHHPSLRGVQHVSDFIAPPAPGKRLEQAKKRLEQAKAKAKEALVDEERLPVMAVFDLMFGYIGAEEEEEEEEVPQVAVLKIAARPFQRVLSVMTVACAILSLIPPLRFAGSICLRSVALLSSCNICVDSWESLNNWDKASRCAKVALVALGLVGSVLSSPLLIVASLVVDTVLQIKDFAISLSNWDFKAVIQFGMITINILVIAAIVLGSWPLIVAASAVSAAVILVSAGFFFVTASIDTAGGGNIDTFFDLVCYSALMGVGMAGSISMSYLHGQTAHNATFKLHNDSKSTQYFYDKDSHLVTTLLPHQSQEQQVPFSHLIDGSISEERYRSGYLRVETPNAFSPLTGYTIAPISEVQPTDVDFTLDVWQNPIAADKIPFTPFGSTSIVTWELV